MKQKWLKNFTVFCFCLVAIAALLMTGCVEEIESPELNSEQSASTTPLASEDKEGESASGNMEIDRLGEGDTVFLLTVIGKDGAAKGFEIYTNKETVGEALLDVGMVEGENGDYGLYIKTVNGETLDFSEDGMYWAFYVDDAYALTGVDKTKIDPSKGYTLKAES